jgi:hypothetical protein
MDGAASIRTPLRAFLNGVATSAQIDALADAERLAAATGSAADAEVKALEALMRRADRLSEIYIRQVLEHEVREDPIAELRARLQANEETRWLSDEAGAERRLLTKRKTVEARHALEAIEAFKELKFELGRIRMRARQSDAEVDGKTTEAAVVKIVGELSKLTRQQTPDLVSWLEQRIAAVEMAIEDEAADGAIDTGKRAELAVLHHERCQKPLRIRRHAGGRKRYRYPRRIHAFH